MSVHYWELEEAANKAYDNDDNDFWCNLSDMELGILWGMCVLRKDANGNVFGGEAFDDEVYDEIERREWLKNSGL